jgi:transposase
MKPRQYKEGVDRESMPLPPTLDECIEQDNPARAIDIYVDTLNLKGMGFEYAGGELTRGQPAYPPSALLKLYIWGYLNRTDSSRRLELETYRNLEVIWLLKGMHPCYKTICSFRDHNKKAIKHIAIDFISLCKDLDLFGGETVGIDGAFFEGDASKASIKTKKSLEKNLKKVEHKIDQYLAKMDAEDQADEAEDSSLQVLKEQLQSCQDKLDSLEKSGETQYSTTDKDARLLKKQTDKGPTAGYNVQIAVDEKNKLIAAHEVVNDGNDSQQLADMALKAKESMGVEELNALADGAYYNQQKIKECLDTNITPYVPVPKRKRSATEGDRFERDDFQYDPEADSYICPAGESLKYHSNQNKNGKILKGYASAAKHCATCPMREQCLPPKTPYRQIYRWEHEEVVDAHKERMGNNGKEQMRKRASLAEHPFGTFKLWLGWTHFLLRGFEKVRAEMNLLITCYNFKRVLNIIGIEAFRAYCEQRNRTVQI